MIDTLHRGDNDGAALVVFTLRPPASLIPPVRSFRHERGADAGAVLVAPAGARAASAGFVLAIAEDVAAMAPETHIGAAHPRGKRRNGRDAGTKVAEDM